MSSNLYICDGIIRDVCNKNINSCDHMEPHEKNSGCTMSCHRGGGGGRCDCVPCMSNDIDDIFDDLLEDIGVEKESREDVHKRLKKKYYKGDELWDIGDNDIWTT